MSDTVPSNAHESRDPQSAIALTDAISEISEECWCAGWLLDCEHSLWRMLTDSDKDHEWGMGVVSAAELANLRVLSERCGGWIRWQDIETGEKFLPIDEWLEAHAVWEKILSKWASKR